jgi:hypothetical protein
MGPIGAVSGCNILILPVDASVLRPPGGSLGAVKMLFRRLRPLAEWTMRAGFAMKRSIERRRLPRFGGITESTTASMAFADYLSFAKRASGKDRG